MPAFKTWFLERNHQVGIIADALAAEHLKWYISKGKSNGSMSVYTKTIINNKNTDHKKTLTDNVNFTSVGYNKKDNRTIDKTM
jgi:hypothetical protein